MLDFSQLFTPPNHGEVLVAPPPAQMAQAARTNHDALAGADVPLLDSTLAACRRRTRQALVGDDSQLVIVTGHQPAFIHPGVWAKHVVAMRLARSLDGVAINLVVDNDAAKTTTLAVPAIVADVISVEHVPFADVRSGLPYELIPRQADDIIASFEQAVSKALGERFDATLMPTFFGGTKAAADARDWVDQVVAGRRAVESALGVSVVDRRVSDVWCSPLLLDMIVHAERFAQSYNRALSQYRRENRIRGAQRPIPDLHIEPDRCETALWAYRAGELRRRVFVKRRKDSCRLWADDIEIGTARVDDLSCCQGIEALLSGCEGWRLRPRALSLTLWARLLLADLFIHGIGGAKYDRITDMIIEDYFGMAPPTMGCVSATLLMALPNPGVTPDALGDLRREARDLVHNPQRNLQDTPGFDVLVRKKDELIKRSRSLRESDRGHRTARRETFEQLRRVNAEMLGQRPEAMESRQRAIGEAIRAMGQSQVAHSREYFFGLFERSRLAALCEALPEVHAFRL